MVEIKIQFDPATGQIGLSGQIDQPILALGLLDMAKEILHRNMRAAAGPKVISMPPVVLGAAGLRNGR